MQITIEIPDGSAELAELQHVVATINTAGAAEAKAAGRPAPPAVTVAGYLKELALAPLRKRVRQAYVRHAQKLSTAELAARLGSLDNIRD